ncbi:MAG TPA: alpha/beta hydrolase [Burkholderiaceae bacterium]|nr:alpha/beta hydrolase [Burkholderiaceae bacterium]
MHAADTIARHNVTISGEGPTLVFAHGFGCDQNMWKYVAPAFKATHRTVLFDHIGCGLSDYRAYDARRHARIEGYAEDVNRMLRELDLRDVVFVGHSVSAMIGALATIAEPQRFAGLVMLGPSPRYINDPPHYHGGFERADIDGLIDMMETNLIGWADFLTPVVMGEGHDPEVVEQLHSSLCSADAFITRRFAQAVFLGDNRADLPRISVPTLVVQVEHDAIAPVAVGEYVHRQIAGSSYRLIDGAGHCPHMTHPTQTIALIREFLQERALA